MDSLKDSRNPWGLSCRMGNPVAEWGLCLFSLALCLMKNERKKGREGGKEKEKEEGRKEGMLVGNKTDCIEI